MKKQIKVNLLAGSIAAFGIMLILTIGFMILSFLSYKDYAKIKVWAGCMAAGVLLLFAALFFFQRHVYQSVLKLLDALLEELRLSMEREHGSELLRQQSKYAELQNQINPHFLYNTLETIRGQAVIDDNYKIADMTEALAKYFRYNISKDNDTVTIEQELENIRNYIQIQQYRFQDRFVFRIYPHADYEEYAGCLIPKMTLQPIVENAIFHGMEEKLEMGHIGIHIEPLKEQLVILVADDGVGMDEETLWELNRRLKSAEGMSSIPEKSGHNGIAMQNVNSRLRLLYGTDYGIRVSSTKDLGTEVEITLPKVRPEEK